MTAINHFGSWLKRRRKSADLTQEELACHLNCSLVTVQKLESGERRPSKQLVKLLAQVFEIPLDEQVDFARFARLETEPDQTDSAVPWRGLHHLYTNLPAPLTSLIGRETELTELVKLISQSDTRLVTIAGPPGVGKTVLALRLAELLLDNFEDGIFFVSPAENTGLKEAVAGQVQCFEQTLENFLTGKRLLLVVDGFENRIESAPELVHILKECHWVKALVTSRITLEVAGEHQFHLGPLALPVDDSLEAVMTAGACKLFIERARAVRSDFRLEPEDYRTVAAICGYLEGLPQPIEAAAAQLEFLSPVELFHRLLQTPCLVYGLIKKSLQSSYEQLDQTEKILFRRLAVFEGEWNLATLEAIFNNAGQATTGLLVTLDGLIRKSLVQVDKSGPQTTYRQFRPIRDFARDMLAQSTEENCFRAAHARFYLSLVKNRIENFPGTGCDRDNIRNALDWCLANIS